MERFSEGDRIRVDIPDETDPDYELCHGTHGRVVAVLTDDAEVVADIERMIDERKEALEIVESDFLIRDQYDLSKEDREILDVIERSREGEVSKTDIEMLVREFFDAFGGDIRGVRSRPARAGGDIFQTRSAGCPDRRSSRPTV